MEMNEFSKAAESRASLHKPEGPKQDPILICRLIASYPRTFFCATLGFHLCFVIASIVLVCTGYNLFPLNFSTIPMELRDEPWLGRYIAWHSRDNYDKKVHRVLPELQHFPRIRFGSVGGLTLIYNTKGGNIYTKKNLRLIKTIEDRLCNFPKFIEQHCELTQHLACVKPVSILRFFDGTYSHISPVFNDPGFDNITGVVNAAYNMPATKHVFLQGLGKNHVLTPTQVQSSLVKSFIPFGWPLPDIEAWDKSKVREVQAEFMYQSFVPLLDEYATTVRAFEVLYYNPELEIHEVRIQAVKDLKLTGCSVVFIFLYVLFHTRTLWVTFLGVFSIICSFVETNFIYRVILDFRYFGIFHAIALFIILGIGTDDFFVFWDCWLESGHYRFPSLAHRLNEAYYKSATSMFVTSFSTMIAFAANLTSPLLATYSFGLFAAILIVLDYLSAITFFVSVVVSYHVCFERWPSLFTPIILVVRRFNKSGLHRPGQDANPEEDTSKKQTPNTVHDIAETSNNCPSEAPCNESVKVQDQVPERKSLSEETITNDGSFSYIDPTDIMLSSSVDPECLPTPRTAIQEESIEDSMESSTEKKKPKSIVALVNFFSEDYFWFITHPVFRWILLGVFTSSVLFLSYSATTLDLDSKRLQFFRDNHKYVRASNLLFGSFVPSDADYKLMVHLVWGVKENDLSSCHFSEQGCSGVGGLDDNFDANKPASQKAFSDLCKTLKELPQEKVESLAILRKIKTNELAVDCFTTNMETFLMNDKASANLNITLPWDWNKTYEFMARHSTFYDASTLQKSFNNYLDIPFTYWLWNAFSYNKGEDWDRFDPLIGEQLDESSKKVLGINYTILMGNKIKYIGVAVTTTLVFETLGYTSHLSIVEEWERFMKEQLSKMPKDLQGGFQQTLAWHWLYLQKSMVDNATFGIILGVAFALPVLIFSTSNLISGTVATFIIAAITVSVIGVIPLMGWSMGVLVSLNMCLVVGLSVDYVVHLAEGYCMSHEQDRLGRLQDALRSMGLPVFSGACTTLGASCFTFFAEIQFFFQFGVFMLCTIGFSLLFSMGLFTTLMGILGPEGDSANVKVLCTRYVLCFIPRLRQKSSAEIQTNTPQERVTTLE